MSVRYLARFSKSGTLRYIGHLDLLRSMQRVVRRSGLPVTYSQGFNPHMLISFALPLPLGMEGLNEYMEISFDEAIPPERIKDMLNERAPEGLCVTGLRIILKDERRSAASVAAADYAFDVPSRPNVREALESILERETITIEKKTKRGVTDSDIRPDIFELSTGHPGEPVVYMKIAAGSERFLNPRAVLRVVFAGLESEPEDFIYTLKRLELYKREGDGFVTMFNQPAE